MKYCICNENVTQERVHMHNLKTKRVIKVFLVAGARPNFMKIAPI
jgi:hypothetical protein